MRFLAHSNLSPRNLMRKLPWRRVTLAAATVAALSIGASAAFADGDDDGDGGRGYQVVSSISRPSEWTIAPGQCNQFPDTASVTGDGWFTSVTRDKINHDGTISRIERDRAEGTATDLAGNTYRWQYAWDSHLRNTLDAPTIFSGKASDSFTLSGGPLRMRATVSGIWTADYPSLATFSLVPLRVKGDPLAFPYNQSSAVQHCDPI